jgi:hypothetical protein
MPSQIAPPIQYQDGDAINGDAFNQHVSHATLQSGAVIEQTDISVSAVPNVNKLDSLVIYDESEDTTNKLRKITIEQLFTNGASLPTEELITSKITAPFWKDIVVTPKVGPLHIGRNYTSNDGFVVTVQDVAHGYDTGTLVKFTAASFGTHNGTFQVTKLTDDSYRFNNGLTVATAAGGGTINSEKVPTVAVIGSATINDDLLVAGNTKIAGNAKISGAVDVGSLLIGGKIPLTAEGNFIGINVKTIPLLANTAWGTNEYQTQSFNVPPGETWTFVWTANTWNSNAGNTRPDAPYQWQIRAVNMTGTIVDTVQAYSGPYSGYSITTRSIVVRNDGTTGNNHAVISPSVSTSSNGTMNLIWTTLAINGRNKWDSVGWLNITLYRQKTASLWYGSSVVL